MDDIRFDGMSRRAAALGASGLAAALLGAGSGNGAAARKKGKKKPKPEPEPLAFAAIAILGAASSGGADPQVNWRVNGFYFHPASQTSGDYNGIFQTPVQLSPDEMKTSLVKQVQDSVSVNLELEDIFLAPDRVAVTIL